MKKTSIESVELLLLILLFVTLAVLMSGCGKQDGTTAPRELQPISNSHVSSTDECPVAIAVEVGLDRNGNGILDPEEIEDTSFLCRQVDSTCDDTDTENKYPQPPGRPRGRPFLKGG